MFDVTDSGLELQSIAPGVTVDELRQETGATFAIAEGVGIPD